VIERLLSIAPLVGPPMLWIALRVLLYLVSIWLTWIIANVVRDRDERRNVDAKAQSIIGSLKAELRNERYYRQKYERIAQDQIGVIRAAAASLSGFVSDEVPKREG
jgi:uncharacterized ion transporter superfamily protein YfcC